MVQNSLACGFHLNLPAKASWIAPDFYESRITLLEGCNAGCCWILSISPFPFYCCLAFTAQPQDAFQPRDAKAEPGDLWYSVELLLRKTCDCSEVSGAETQQTSLELCVCCNVSLQKQLSVSKRDARGSFSPLWGKVASLQHQLASRLKSFCGKCAFLRKVASNAT